MEGHVGLGARWARAGVLALVVLLTAVGAHVSGGGYLPGTTSLAFLLIASTLACYFVVARRSGIVQTILVLVGGQTLLHAAFATAAGHVGEVRPQAASPVDLAGVGRGGSLSGQFDAAVANVCGTCESALTLNGLLPDLTGPHAAMAALHLVAAAVVGAYLAVGEKALWSLVDHAAAYVVRLAAWVTQVPAVHLPPAATPVVALAAPLPPRELLLVKAQGRRGPPAIAFA